MKSTWKLFAFVVVTALILGLGAAAEPMAAAFSDQAADGGPGKGNFNRAPCEVLGFEFGTKIESPENGTYDLEDTDAQTVTLAIDVDAKELHFETSDFDVDAVVVRGGPDVKVYKYPGDADTADDLPLPNETPSGTTVPHPFKLKFVAFCYGEAQDPGPDPDPDPDGEESCGLGFWKNHPEVWEGYEPDDELNDVFDNVPADLGDKGLMEALRFGGGPGALGGAKLLLRMGVVSLLNAAHPDIAFDSEVDELVGQVSEALASGNRKTMLDLAEQLDAMNNRGCPLAGGGYFERPDDGFEGVGACTVDFWKEHVSDWQAWTEDGFLTALPDDKIQDLFDVTPFLSDGQLDVGGQGDTLLAALSFGGGPDDAGAARILLRTAVASWLNQEYFGQDYGYAGELIEAVGEALQQGREEMLDLAGELDVFNQAECIVVEEAIVVETRASVEDVYRWILRTEQDVQPIYLPMLSRN